MENEGLILRGDEEDNGGSRPEPHYGKQHDTLYATPSGRVWHLSSPWRLPGGDRIPLSESDGSFAHDGSLAHALHCEISVPMRVVRRSASLVSLEPLRIDEGDGAAARDWAEFSLACTRLTEPPIEPPRVLELSWGMLEDRALTRVRSNGFAATRYLDRPPEPGTVCESVVFCWGALDFSPSGAPTPRMSAVRFMVDAAARMGGF